MDANPKYKCLDCGYKGNKRYIGGRCPGCDSYNVQNLAAAVAENEKPTSPWPSRFRIAYLVLFVILMLTKFFVDSSQWW